MWDEVISNAVVTLDMTIPTTHSAPSLLPAMTVLVLLGVVSIQVCDFYYITLTTNLCGAYTMPDTIFNTFTCVNSQQLYEVGTLIISILQMMIQAEKG